MTPNPNRTWEERVEQEIRQIELATKCIAWFLVGCVVGCFIGRLVAVHFGH